MKDNQMKPRKTQAVVKLLAVMVMLGFAFQAMAQQPLPKPRGLEPRRDGDWPGYVQQKVVNEEGTKLTLTSYITGEVTVTQTAKPTDIVLVLDVSGSMDDDISAGDGWYPYNRSYSYSTISGGSYYYRWTNGEYYQVKGVDNKRTVYTHRTWLYFDVNDVRYYLKGSEVIRATNQNNPTYDGRSGTKPYRFDSPTTAIDPVENGLWSTDATVWTGTLYRWESGTISKMGAIKNAVSTFIDVVYQHAQNNLHYDAAVGDSIPAEHRISIVKFSDDSYYSSNHFAEGNHKGASGDSRYNYTELVKNLTAAYTETGVNTLKTALNALDAGGATAADYGMSLATEVFSTANTGYYNADHNMVVVMFTDGDPNHGSGFSTSVASTTIGDAKTMKDKGIKVYTVGVFDNPNPNESTYMNYVSSNYPKAENMTTPGDGPYTDKYYFNAKSAGELSSMFTTIAQEAATVSMQLNEQTIVQDVISDYFKLPAGTVTSDIKVYTANCTGGVEATHTYTFGTPTAFDANIEFGTYEGRQAIKVSNFNFTQNYVAVLSTGARGKELIIEIPIVPQYNEYGVLPTNAEGSTIYPNGGDDPLNPFPTPVFYVKQTTWVEHTYTRPSTFPENPGATDTIELTSNEDLAWFISYVSGYNGCTAHPAARAKLTADVDMHQYCWVPIGGGGVCYNHNGSGENGWSTSGPTSHGFHGFFDGQGHVIDRLNNYDAYTMPQAGMFGFVDGGTIQNVFITNADYQPAVGQTITDGLCTGIEGHFGILADTICNGAVLKNSEAHGWMKTYNIKSHMLPETEEYTSPLQDPEKCYIGGLVGLIGRDRAGATKAATVHSCVSVASLAGYSMGGAVNEIGENSKLYNSYSYPTFYSWDPTKGTDLGGLAAKNIGKVINCYLRERATNATLYHYGINAAIGRVNAAQAKGGDRAEWHKGLLVGNNQATIQYCYVPDAWKSVSIVDADKKTTSFVGYGCATDNKPSGLASFDDTETPYLYKHQDTKLTPISATGANSYIPAQPNNRLLQTLNAWTGTSDGAGTTKWFRTTANGINNDYPVLKIEGLQSVASDDMVVLFYGDVNNALAEDGRSMQTSNAADDVICLYENTNVTETNNGRTLYINEDVAITQEASLDAYVGITLGANDWHMFATPLSNAPMGVNYSDIEQHTFTNYDSEDTPEYIFFNEKGTSAHDGYFPSHVYGKTYNATGSNYYDDWDYYCWSEPHYHYINFKRNINDHYFEGVDANGVHAELEYAESDQPSAIGGNANLIPGKGYMLAINAETFLQSHGTLNYASDVERSVTYSPNPFCVGYNLIGNPYQSYLNFDAFGTANDIDSYTILDEDSRGYRTYTIGQSNREDGLGYLYMHQGFFVEVAETGSVTFTNAMRSCSNDVNASFRGTKAAYPWVKLTMTEESGYRDYTTVEFNRPELGGGKKMVDLRLGDAQIYVHNGQTNYSTFFATRDIQSVPVRFTTVADGTFTLNWEMNNDGLNNIYLVDNITGVQVDMLSCNEYKFEGRTSDYASRFKIVFELTEEDDDDMEEAINFAFQMDGNLIVNGQGRFDMYDASGRLVMSTNLYDAQNTVALSEMARGIYVLRLADTNDVKVQKIVVR